MKSFGPFTETWHGQGILKCFSTPLPTTLQVVKKWVDISVTLRGEKQIAMTLLRQPHTLRKVPCPIAAPIIACPWADLSCLPTP